MIDMPANDLFTDFFLKLIATKQIYLLEPIISLLHAICVEKKKIKARSLKSLKNK